MDQAAMDARYDVSSLYIPGTYENLFTKADTLEELAEKMGIDAGSWLQPWRNIMPLSKRAWTRLSAARKR